MDDTPPDPRLAVPPTGGGSAPGDRSGARLARAARAAEELCATLWEAMHDELRLPDVRRVAELAERLAQVCSAVEALAGMELAGMEPARELVSEEEREFVSAEERELASPEERERESPEERELELPGESEIAIHDIRQESSQASSAPAESSVEWVIPGGRGPGEGVRSDGPGSIATGVESPIAWAESLDMSLERHAVDGLPFAALLVEVSGLERLSRAEPAPVLADLLDRVERALRPELRPSDTVVRESAGRWWLTASRTDAAGARTLGERLARTVSAGASHRGAPLEVAVGIAVCPVDGDDIATLAAHADVSLYAARAVGQPVAPMDDAL
jgi:GGDEF domain-containing protein